MTDKLLPCPFCGGKAEFHETSSTWVRCEDCGAEIQCQVEKKDAAFAWNRRAALVADEVNVSALQWDEFSTSSRRHFQSNTILGQFQIGYLGEFECWQLYSPQKSSSWKECFSRHASPDEAKAAAQSDYETRIRSALVDVPAVESEPELTCPHIDKAIASGELSESVKAELHAIKDINSQLRYGMWVLKAQLAEAHPPRSLSNEGWRPIETAPKDGSKFDVWCVNPQHPESYGVRLNNVQMRGDGSGLGFVMYLREGVYWQYLDARENDSIFPTWEPTHWQPLPNPPLSTRKGSSEGDGSSTITKGCEHD